MYENFCKSYVRLIVLNNSKTHVRLSFLNFIITVACKIEFPKIISATLFEIEFFFRFILVVTWSLSCLKIVITDFHVRLSFLRITRGDQ